jgi:hypothetical protein
MASLGETFRPEDVPAAEFDPVPGGDYLAQVIDSDVKDTKTGTGQMLNLTWEVMTGPQEGRMVFDRINIRSQNEKAQAIGLRQLANICTALGVASISDSEELHFRPLIISVVIKEDKTGQYGPQNNIKKYSPPNGTAPTARTPTPTPAQATPAPAAVARQQTATKAAPAGKRPWA